MSQGFIIPFGTGDTFDFGGFGVDWKIDGDLTERRFSVVHHPIAPRTLAAPLHRHHREDEYSYIISGKLGALLGDEVVIAEPGGVGPQAAGAMAYVLERGRQPLRDHRNHFACRFRKLLSRNASYLARHDQTRSHRTKVCT